MGPQGAVEIVYRRELQQAADPVARRAELVDEYTEKYANPYEAAERGYVDDVIDPAETRVKLIAGPRACSARSAKSCRSASTGTCRCDGVRGRGRAPDADRRGDGGHRRRDRDGVAAAGARRRAVGAGRTPAWRFSGRWWARPVAARRDRPYGRMASSSRRSPTTRSCSTTDDAAHRFADLAARHRLRRSTASTVRTLPRPGGELLCRVRHGQRRALRRDASAASSRDSTTGPSFSAEPGRAALPGDDEPRRDRGDRRHRSGRRDREGRPHRRRARRRVRGLPRASTAARSATASTPCGATTTATAGRRTRSAIREIVLPGVRVAPARHRDPLRDDRPHHAGPARVARRSRARRATGPCWCSGTTTPWSPDSAKRSLTYFGINPDDSDGLVDVIAAATRHPRLLRRAHPSQPRAPLQRHRRRSRTSRSPA